MRTLTVLFLIQSLTLISTANAAIVCNGVTSFGSSLKVTLAEDQSAHVEVTNQDGSKELEQDFKTTDDVWDGHMTGIITAPGLSVKYENQYGCIRNIVVTTNVRGGGVGFIDTVKIRTCRGGSTPDDLCMPHGI